MTDPHTSWPTRGMIFAVFLFLTCLALWPLPMQLSSHLPTYPHLERSGDGDPYMFCWNLWWVKGWLAGNHPLLFTQMLHHPFGLSLARHTLSIGNGLAGAPLMTFLNVVSVHNLLLLFHTFFTGLFIFLIVRELSGGIGPALIAGEAALLWPARMSHSLTHLNIAGTAWIPIAFFCLIRIQRSKNVSWIAAAATSIAFLGATCWHHLIAFLCVVWLFLDIRIGKRQWTYILKYFSAVVLGICLLLPLILPLAAADPSIPDRSQNERARFSIQPASFVVPSFNHPLWKSAVAEYYDNLSGNPIEGVGYLGIVVLIWIIAGLIFARPLPLRWLWASLILTILALGPELRTGAGALPLPYKLFQYIPGLNAGRTPGRFLITAGLTLSVSLGLMLTQLFARFQRKQMGTVFLFLLILLDFLPGKAPLAEAHLPKAFISALPADSSHGILDIPAHWSYRRYQFNQIAHHRPIASGFVSRIPRSVFDREKHFPLLLGIGNPERAVQTLLEAEPYEISDLFNLLDADTAILHRPFLRDDSERNMHAFRTRFGPAILFEDSEMLVIRKPDPINETESPRAYFYRNWFPEERWRNMPGPVRWAGADPEIMIFAPQNIPGMTATFDVRPAPQKDQKPQTLKIEFNGSPVFEGTLRAGWMPMEIAIPSPFKTSGNLLTFEFRCTTRPSELHNGENRDKRALSAAVKNLSIARN